MKSRFVAPFLLVTAVLACTSGSARAGLFSHGYGGCGCESSCGAPDVVWGACCAPQPSWCGCGHGFRHGLFARLRACHPHRLFNCCGSHGGGCCESTCGAEPACGAPVACEATCGAAPACESTCGAVAACEPACGAPAESACGCEADCAPACDSCCRHHGGGLLRRLFHHRHHASCCESACDVSCGGEPSCGCN
jgi:hypothetical protein